MNLGSVHGFVHGVLNNVLLEKPLRLFENVFDNVLLEHGGLPHVLPVHLTFFGVGARLRGFGFWDRA